MSDNQGEEQRPKIDLPDRLANFTAREMEIQNVISFLRNEENAVVAVHGEPGLGKTAIAIEVSHKLREDHEMTVIFFELSNAATESEMIQRVCLDIGINSEGESIDSNQIWNPALIFWLKNIRNKVIFVMDNIDNLLEEEVKASFCNFVCLLREYSNQFCQILTTSRTSYEIPDLSAAEIKFVEISYAECILQSEETKNENDQAELLMVEYYLFLAHDLTEKNYTKLHHKSVRETLRKEAQNIENVLKICCRQENSSSVISTCLEHSKIFASSPRFLKSFSLLVKTVIPGCLVEEFLQQCSKQAKEWNEHVARLKFECLLADLERMKSIGKSTTDSLDVKMDTITKEFKTHHKMLKKNKSLCAHYYYVYGRYLLRKSEDQKGDERINTNIEARTQLLKSLELRESLTNTLEGNVDKIFLLVSMGSLFNRLSTIEYGFSKIEKSKELSKKAQKHYEEAIEISQNELGEHELTSSCCKALGDIFLKIKNYDKAEKMYNIAKEIREALGVRTSRKHVFLLNNIGIVLTRTGRANEAISMLKTHAERDELDACRGKVCKTLAFAHDSLQMYSEDVANYARISLEFLRSGTTDFERLENILMKCKKQNE